MADYSVLAWTPTLADEGPDCTFEQTTPAGTGDSYSTCLDCPSRRPGRHYKLILAQKTNERILLRTRFDAQAR